MRVLPIALGSLLLISCQRPSVLSDLPADHPANAQATTAAYTPPPNPFDPLDQDQGEAPSTTAPAQTGGGPNQMHGMDHGRPGESHGEPGRATKSESVNPVIPPTESTLEKLYEPPLPWIEPQRPANPANPGKRMQVGEPGGTDGKARKGGGSPQSQPNSRSSNSPRGGNQDRPQSQAQEGGER